MGAKGSILLYVVLGNNTYKRRYKKTKAVAVMVTIVMELPSAIEAAEKISNNNNEEINERDEAELFIVRVNGNAHLLMR